MSQLKSILVFVMLFVSLLFGILECSEPVSADIQGDWVEELMRDVPTNIFGIGIGDVDHDGHNEVVVGMYITTNELRMYKKQDGLWKETIIADTPTSVENLVVGDADNDGATEIVCTITTPTNEVRMYEYESGVWVQNLITTAPVHILSLALGDADNDGLNEVVIGLVNTTNDVRAYRKSGAWLEENITDVNFDVTRVAVGDADNDGANEVIMGMGGNNPFGFPPVYISNEVRAYEKSGGFWLEENITDTGNLDVNSLVIGDPDGDGKNEVCVGRYSIWTGGSDAQTHEKKGATWFVE